MDSTYSKDKLKIIAVKVINEVGQLETYQVGKARITSVKQGDGLFKAEVSDKHIVSKIETFHSDSRYFIWFESGTVLLTKALKVLHKFEKEEANFTNTDKRQDAGQMS